MTKSKPAIINLEYFQENGKDSNNSINSKSNSATQAIAH